MNESNKNIVGWFTSKGKHIPIMNGETKDMAIKRFFEKDKSAKNNSSADKEPAEKKERIENLSSKDSNGKNYKKKTDKKNDNIKTKPKKDIKDIKPKKSEPKIVSVHKKTDSYKKVVDTKNKQIADAKAKSERLNAEKQYEESLKQGNKVGIKDRHLTFKGKDIKPLDTSGVRKEMHKKHEGSLNDYITVDGNITADRLKAHQEIIEKYFGDHKPYAPGQEKKALFTGGGGASGKGTLFTDPNNWKYSSYDNPVIVDADKLKSMLNEYDYNHGRHKSKNLTDWSTGWYHEESSALAKQIYQMAVENNFPVMYDGTATSAKTLTLLKQAEDNGYTTEMNFLFSDYKSVMQNSLKRYMRTGRLVPLERQMDAHSKAFKAVLELNNKVDKFTLWDNRIIGKEKIVKDGKEITVDKYKSEPILTNTKGKLMRISNGQAWKFFQGAEKEFHLYPSRYKEFYKAAKSIEDQQGWKQGKGERWLEKNNPKEYARKVEQRRKRNSNNSNNSDD